MIFILLITLFNPLVANAEEINSPIKSIEEKSADIIEYTEVESSVKVGKL